METNISCLLFPENSNQPCSWLFKMKTCSVYQNFHFISWNNLPSFNICQDKHIIMDDNIFWVFHVLFTLCSKHSYIFNGSSLFPWSHTVLDMNVPLVYWNLPSNVDTSNPFSRTNQVYGKNWISRIFFLSNIMHADFISELVLQCIQPICIAFI